MGMSTHVVGIKPPDETWKRMKKVWDACCDAGIGIPKDVLEYFGNEEPDDKGVLVELEKHVSVTKWKDDMQQGFEVEVERIPKDVKIIRFYNSW